MGLGQGSLNIFTQNCEHGAQWCKTGQQWCKQTFSIKRSSFPFPNEWEPERRDALKREIAKQRFRETVQIEKVLITLVSIAPDAKVDKKQ
jgi:hypothetical protein